ncbi:MAG: type II toxin-antitoxin system HicB family antitoxin [Acidimicrobiales bacterium]
MPTATSTLTVPFTLTVDVHEIEGGGFYGEVRQLPGCLSYADTLEELADAMREALRDYFAEPGVMTEETARELAAIQGTTDIPPGPYPLRREYQPPAWWTEAHEDE